jgi:tetratricopeptide (TPR) repeat protein
MKNKFFVAALISFTYNGFAQTLQELVTKTDNENFEIAEAGFRALIAKDPTKGESYFYFGENYFKRGDADSANILYIKGAEVNATFGLNYVGLGKVLLTQGKTEDAKTQFFKAITLGANKNAELLRKVGEAWLVTDVKNADEAIVLANKALKMEPKNPENYILLGDALLEKNPTDGSAPIKNYQMATTLNPKSTKGILREGKLYQRGRNYNLALDYYKKAIGIDPNYAPAYREIAELYSLAGQPARSIENWKKYLELNNSDYARYRFMSALFSNKQYAEAVKEYEGLKKANFDNLYLERLAAYSYAEMGNKTDTAAYTKGLKASNAFFAKAPRGFKFIANDYKYKGILLLKGGKDSLGVIEMEKAIELDPTMSGDIYGTLASISAKNKKYDKVILYMEKKAKGSYLNLNVNECFDLGKAYYFNGVAKQNGVIELRANLAKKKKPTDSPELNAIDEEVLFNYRKADSAFNQLTQLNANWPWGYTWRGRTNALMDPKITSNIAKEMFEKVLSLVKPEEKLSTYKPNVIEAYEYLGYYYVTKKDDAKAKEYWTMVKEMDPANEKANNYLNPKKPAATPSKPSAGKK